MITPTVIYEFLIAFPKFVSFMKTAYADFKDLQIKKMDIDNAKYITELHTEIEKLKGAKTDKEIADSIAAINSGR